MIRPITSAMTTAKSGWLTDVKKRLSGLGPSSASWLADPAVPGPDAAAAARAGGRSSAVTTRRALRRSSSAACTPELSTSVGGGT